MHNTGLLAFFCIYESTCSLVFITSLVLEQYLLLLNFVLREGLYSTTMQCALREAVLDNV